MSTTFRDAIAAAGYNTNNLRADQIDLDLSTDVPARSPLAEVRDAGARASAVDLEASARALYGDWRFVIAAKGRGGELALARAYIKPGMTVLTTGLFRTTQRSVATHGAKVEVMPAAHQEPGSSDISLAWLDEKFAAGGVGVVYLEPAAGAVFGWPMRLERLREVKARCARHGAKLWLDATRLLANCVALGHADHLDRMREVLALADAFVVSAAKECLVPHGGIAGVRDLELQRAMWLNVFEEGANIEAPSLRAELAAGIDAIRAKPSYVTDRRRQLELLAARLRAANIRYVEPIGSHAVFALISDPHADRAHRNHELQAHLFAHTGIKFMFGHHPAHPGFVVRLPLQLARLADADLDRIVAALSLATTAPGSVPELVPVASECVHTGYFSRFAPKP